MRAPRRSPRRLPESLYDVLTEASLVLFSIAVVVSFTRLFIDSEFFIPVVASTLSAHILAATVRWARGGLIISLLVSLVGLVVTSAFLFPPTTVSAGDGFLNGAVLNGFVDDLQLSWEEFQRVLAPAEATPPFLLLIAIVMWVVAFLSDWAAFRLRAAGEALIPGTAVFVFGALFAAEQNRFSSSVVFIGSALLFVLLHRLSETATAGAWLGVGGAKHGQSSLLRGGLAIVAATMVSGAVVAQALPGYGEEPVVDISDLDEPDDPRVVLSPLVDIQSRLINQPDVEVFRVRSEQPDYWRITSLDVFDGRIWRSRGSFESASGPLETELPSGTNFEAVAQQFDINRLGGIWLPAAYEPSQVLAAPPGVEFEYERESGTLIVNRDLTDSDGLSYTINSAVPIRDVAAIASAGDSLPTDIRDRYLDLPDDFSQRVTDEANAIIAQEGATTPYEKALALQRFFRDPTKFQYSLDVSNGHSSEDLEEFLFTTRTGYCEQFSGTYAAMARSIGLPARVAVGFTKGELVTGETDLYTVTGKNAHAWPEVWIDGIGWLRFEPTPGRGAPGDEVYTGFPEAQASVVPGAPATTVAPSDTVPAPRPNELNPDGGVPTTTNAPSGDRAESGTISGGGVSATTVWRGVLGLSLLLLILVVPLSFGVYRARRQRASVLHDPKRRIGLAWNSSRAAMELLGIPTRNSETPREIAERVDESDPETAKTLQELAEGVTVAIFGGERVPDANAERAEALSRSLAARARERVGGWTWWTYHANPLNVFRTKQGLWGNLRP